MNDDQLNLLDVPLYDRMKARGVDMSWYDRSKQLRTKGEPKVIPLETDQCSNLSVYLLMKDGSLWTLQDDQPYHEVREGKHPRVNDVYVCLCCKAQSTKLAALRHIKQQ